LIEAIFKNLCPNCGGDITSERLLNGLLCEKCLPQQVSKEFLCEHIKEEKYDLCSLKERYNDWEKVFRKFIGFDPWELQKFWARKLLLGRSFALLAPTGIGKTSWGLATALYFSKKGKRSYIILPTKLLILQSYEKLKDKVKESDLLVFGLDESNKEREEKKKRLANGDFKILITSSMFLYKNVDLIPKDFAFIFVDDVDSFLKTAKNIDKALYLLGFDEKDISFTMNYIKMKRTQANEEKVKAMQEEVRKIASKAKGVMVVASATSDPKSERIRLFKELLSFDVGRPIFYLRNVEDVYEEVENLDDALVRTVKRLGKGGLVFLSSDFGKERVDYIKNLLESNGIKTETYENLSPEVLEKYRKGEIEVLIGISSYRNPLARGLDMPEVIRYAVFYGVPKIVVNLDIEGNVKHLLLALSSIRPLIARDKDLEEKVSLVDKWMKALKKFSSMPNPPVDKVNELKNEIKNFILSKEIHEKISNSDEVVLRQEDEKWILVVSDITGYLQASGRTSRLYVGGISKGLSYILVDDKKVLNNLLKKSRWWFSTDITFKEARSINIDEILRQIDEDREKVRRKEGRRDDFLKPVLVIVESPHKAWTIANFFGKPISRNVNGQELYEVITEDKYLVITASFGHVLDLNKEIGYFGVIEKEKFIPVYEPIDKKERMIEGIRDASKEFDMILVATDPDTEGEKISWDLKNLCTPFVKEIRRMEFHEITKKAILNALKESRNVNENLVKAQVVRRISDRWVGFELSQLIQKVFSKSSLSAGRVQTPVLGWVIERAKENRKKIHIVSVKRYGLDIKFEFEDKQKAQKFYNGLKYIQINKSSEKIQEKSPLPPYTTDALLKDASEKYKISVSRTMEILQELFERGFITYHRTDSTRVSDVGISVAKSYIAEQFGEEYFKGRTWGEGGAHECIRPTRVLDVEDIKSMIYSGELEDFTPDHLKIYDLIFKRFISSQMRNVVVKSCDITVKAFDKEQTFEIYEEIIQEGYNKIFPIKLTKIPTGEVVVVNYKSFYSVPKVPLFTQGTLVEEMKKRGLGRPSTYATIVSRLLERGYVVEKEGYLIPTPLGEKVYKFLNSSPEKFKFVREDFTRELEQLMDKVELGEEDYQKILKNLKMEIERI